MLRTLVVHLLNSLAASGVETWLVAAGLVVRLLPEYTRAYPWVPAGVWLAAHRREGDDGVVWLDSNPNPAGGQALPIYAHHVEVRASDP